MAAAFGTLTIILIVIGLLIEGFGSKHWYWVLTSAIVTAVIALSIVGAVIEGIRGLVRKVSGGAEEMAALMQSLAAAMNASADAMNRATAALQSKEWQLARAEIDEARRLYGPVNTAIADGRVKGREARALRKKIARVESNVNRVDAWLTTQINRQQAGSGASSSPSVKHGLQ